MIEKIAKAIRKANEEGLGRTYTGLTEAMARAALEAMREPTEEMEYAVWKNGMWEVQSPLIVWQAMIDAALAEKS